MTTIKLTSEEERMIEIAREEKRLAEEKKSKLEYIARIAKEGRQLKDMYARQAK